MTTPRIRAMWERLPSDWMPVEDGASLLKELKREMPWGHQLRGKDLTVFARADYHDDIALVLPDGSIAEVHLTWNKERDPAWPYVSGPMSFADWLKFREEDREFREHA